MSAPNRREELVQAAFKQIAERGFEGLRTRDVSAEVGVNVATLHYYFPTKEALIKAVLDQAMARFRTTLEPHGSPHDPAVRGIVDEMFAGWQTTMRGLLRRAVKGGRLRPEMDSDAVAAFVIATLMGSTLPQFNESKRGDQAVRQLERALGID